jgi:hypothetical protein
MLQPNRLPAILRVTFMTIEEGSGAAMGCPSG